MVDIYPKKLTKEENDKLGAWFRSKNVAPVCTVCRRYDYSNYRINYGLPLIVSSCNNCGHVLLFDPQQIGI